MKCHFCGEDVNDYSAHECGGCEAKKMEFISSKCTCGNSTELNTVHRADSPCFHYDSSIIGGQLDQFVIEEDKTRNDLVERLCELEEKRYEDFAELTEIAYSLGNEDGNPIDFIKMRVHQATESIRLILPLAKGYAAAHPLKINDDVVAHAERFIESLEHSGDAAEKPGDWIESLKRFRGVDEADFKDGKRYRWLRDIGDDTWTPLIVRDIPGWGISAGDGCLFDKAIDAAIEASKERK